MMMKKYLICAVAGLAMAACSNDEENMAGADNKPTAEMECKAGLVPLNTRGTMQLDLVPIWQTKLEKGTAAGDTVGAFSYYGTTGVETQLTNNEVCTLDGEWVNGIGQTIHAFTGDNLGWMGKTAKHTFYVYYPYVATAGIVKEAVPFTLPNVQTQTKADVWDNNNGKYNFMYYSTADPVVQPADNTIPFKFNRLLPVAEFNILRDDATLDDYTLSNIVVKPTSGTMATGATTINLTNVGNATSVSLGSTAAQYQLNSNIAVNSIAMDNSAALYMSLPPAAAKEYTITATFKKGTDTKTIAVKRTDAYTIEKGKGNIVRYYLKSSNAAAPDTGTPETGSSVTIDGLTWAPANLVYIDNTWRFANTLSECYADTENGTLNNVGPWADYGSKACYWQYGSLTPIDATTVFNKPTSASNNLSTATIGENPWPADTDPCRKVAGGKWRLPKENELTGLSNWLNSHAIWTSVIQNGQTYYGTLSGVKNSDGTFNANSVFIPAAGLYNYTKKFSSVGASGFYWSSEHYVYGDTVWGQTLRTMNNSSEASQDSEAGPQVQYQNQGLSVRCVKTAE